MDFYKTMSISIAIILDLSSQGCAVRLRRCRIVIRHLDASGALFAAEIERQNF